MAEAHVEITADSIVNLERRSREEASFGGQSWAAATGQTVPAASPTREPEPGDFDDLPSDLTRRTWELTPPARSPASATTSLRSALPQGRAFCADKTVVIDYKEVNRFRRYLSERAKIEPRRKTGTCAGHQRELAVALKRARHVALLPQPRRSTCGQARGLDSFVR